MLKKALACLVPVVALFAASTPAPVYADHTCSHSCWQRYLECKSGCTETRTCWVCLPDYQNCEEYICGGG